MENGRFDFVFNSKKLAKARKKKTPSRAEIIEKYDKLATKRAEAEAKLYARIEYFIAENEKEKEVMG